MAQSQYAQKSDLVTLSVSPAAAQRFGDAAIEGQLQAASALADSFIVSQFVLPLKTDPVGWDMSLTRAVCDIAAYYLYCQFGFNPNAPQDQLIKARYEMAIDWLSQIRDKKLFPHWEDNSGVDPGDDEGGPFIISSPPVGFTDRGIVSSDNWTPSPGGVIPV